MNKQSHYLKKKNKKGQKGGVLPLVAISLVLFVAFAALTIDLGYLFAGRNELQNAADAAALGAARKLGKIYQTMAQAGIGISGYNVVNDDGDKAAIIAVGEAVASQNKATREGIIIDAAQGDIQIGVWDQDSDPSFTETDVMPNAVRVTARRDTKNINPATDQIGTFFSGVLGPDSFPVRADATAALLGQSTAEPGELELPVGIDLKWFNDRAALNKDFCGNIIRLSPTGTDSCAGWTTFDETVSSDTNLSQILLPDDDDRFDPDNPDKTNTYHVENPESQVGEDFYYTGGLGAAFDDLLLEFKRKGEPVDSVYDPDYPEDIPRTFQDYLDAEPPEVPPSPIPLCAKENGGTMACPKVDDEYDIVDQLKYPCINKSGLYVPLGCKDAPEEGGLRYAHEWTTTVVVYEASETCANPTQGLKTEGYAQVTLYDVGESGDKTIYARVECNYVSPEDSRGGGPNFGILAPIPNLVE